MQILKTYSIQRNGKSLWLSQNQTPLDSDVILEERELTIADDGKVLATKDGQIIGTCLWNKDNQELIEIDALNESEETVQLEIKTDIERQEDKIWQIF